MEQISANEAGHLRLRKSFETTNRRISIKLITTFAWNLF